MTRQRDFFLATEGDDWLLRNPDGSATPELDDLIAMRIPPGGSVLEIGCSDGRRLRRLSARTDAKFSGVDPSQTAISRGSAMSPDMDLRVGTADELPFDSQFDVVILGFFLYVVDRELLSRVASEVDRVLNPVSTLAIIDFDPDYPLSRPYRASSTHRTYKMDYSGLFLAQPAYTLEEKFCFFVDSASGHADHDNRVALWLCSRDLSSGYELIEDA